MKKSYHIRPNSPAAYAIEILPFIVVAAVLVIGGLMTSADYGLL